MMTSSCPSTSTDAAYNLLPPKNKLGRSRTAPAMVSMDDLFDESHNNTHEDHFDPSSLVRKSEYVIYKLKEMGKISEKDVMQICNQFNKLDENNSGKITLHSLLQSHL